MIQTERINLKLLTPSDLEEALNMFQEPNTFQYIRPLQGKTREEYLSFLQVKLKEIETQKGYYWVVRHQDSGEFIGAINLTPISGTDQIQIGWQIRDQFRRQGYASEAAQLAFDYGLHETPFHPIYAVFEKANIASERILQKLGFRYFQTFREKERVLEKYIFDFEK